MEWFAISANNGSRLAQRSLGLSYRQAKDPQANFWLWQAADQGDKIALATLAADGDKKAQRQIPLSEKLCVMFNLLIKNLDNPCQ